MLYVKQIPENHKISDKFKVVNQFREEDVAGSFFCIVCADLTPEQVEIIKKVDNFPIFNVDPENLDSDLDTAFWGFLQSYEALKLTGLLTDLGAMSKLEIESRLMCCSYIDHINVLKQANMIDLANTDTLIEGQLKLLELEVKSLIKENK